jgi:hypothetical protein
MQVLGFRQLWGVLIASHHIFANFTVIRYLENDE